MKSKKVICAVLAAAMMTTMAFASCGESSSTDASSSASSENSTTAATTEQKAAKDLQALADKLKDSLDDAVKATMTAFDESRIEKMIGVKPDLYKKAVCYVDASGASAHEIDCFEANDLVSLRDRALIFLGFAGAFRRSELVRIQVEELTFTPQGLMIFVPQSKGDQYGRGSTIAIPYAPDEEICAVRALKAWLDAAQIHTGPLFRPFTKAHSLRNTQLSDKSVALIVKKYAKLAGLDEKQFAGHSLRRGFATSAAQHDVDALSIMRQTRHKSEKMVHRYIEQGNIFKENPLNRMYGK